MSFGSKWFGTGIARFCGAARKAACPWTVCDVWWLAGCLWCAPIILIPCDAWASSPKARAGCGNPARPDPWRGLCANMIPTPTELSRLVEMFRWLASFIYLDQGASGFIPGADVTREIEILCRDL